MRDEGELLREAVNLKRIMNSRVEKVLTYAKCVAKFEMGVMPSLKPERLATIRMELEEAAKRQLVDGAKYAALRWALGYSSEMNSNDLDLDFDE